MSTNNQKDAKELEWENRILCSDEACIGTIGKDGKCRECGKPYEGTLPESLASGEPAEDDQASDPQSESEDVGGIFRAPDDESDDAPAAAADGDDWDSRTLCSDESCIGVIGPDGRCKECGKPYEG